MSQPVRVARSAVDDTDIQVRNRRMLLVGGVMVVLAIIVAAGYWITHESGKAPPPPTKLFVTSAGGDLVVGVPGAKYHVVITEAFNCSECAAFERGIQTFMRADAAAGIVQTRYVIPAGNNAAYGAALASNPAHAYDVHDQIFAAGTQRGPGKVTVTIDGTPLTQSNPLDLADALETALAQ